ncbi:MAG: hypothetical protein V5B78_05495 [Desulfohalobiaceae bacterium]
MVSSSHFAACLRFPTELLAFFSAAASARTAATLFRATSASSGTFALNAAAGSPASTASSHTTAFARASRAGTSGSSLPPPCARGRGFGKIDPETGQRLAHGLAFSLSEANSFFLQNLHGLGTDFSGQEHLCSVIRNCLGRLDSGSFFAVHVRGVVDMYHLSGLGVVEDKARDPSETGLKGTVQGSAP